MPFMMLYLTGRLGIAPAGAALMVSVLGAGSFIAQLTGGELADRFGRRPVMLLSFFVSPVAMIVLGLTRDIWLLVGAMFVLGFFMDLYRPAVSATVVDLVPAVRRARAFGYIYWAINIGIAVAPIVAGLMANIDYFLLFVGDAVTTAVFGVIVWARVPETQSRDAAKAARVPIRLRVGQVAREPILLTFTLLTMLLFVIHSQSYVTLPLSMADSGLLPSDYGLAIAVNGFLIVLVTLPLSRGVERWSRLPGMALAALLAGAGFGLTALATTLPFYALTVAIWTVGEIIDSAIGPVFVSEMSPAPMRGLFQGIFGSAFGLAFFIGPALGGFIYAQFGSDALWGAILLLGIGISIGYLLLSPIATRRPRAAPS